MRTRSKRTTCTLCGSKVDPRLTRHLDALDPDLAERLIARHPDEARHRRLCPNCVEAFVHEIVHEEGLDALHEHIQASWPVDPEATYGVLPVPMRLHANPLYRGSGVTMALLDSGFSAHPDLVGRRNRIKIYVDATTDEVREHEAAQSAGGLSWHGLMTSTVAAGDGRLSLGRYRGLASDADLVLVKISDAKGGVHDDGIERGLRWLLANHRHLGVRVLNLSVGGDEEQHLKDSPVDLLVQALVSEGVVVVAAAGNAGERRLVPPASAPGAITVGGLDDQNLMDPAAYRIWHSNYGPTVDGAVKPELVAPSIWVAAPILPGSSQIPEAAALERLANAPTGRVATLFERLGRVAGLATGDGPLEPDEIRSAARRRQVEAQYLAAYYKSVEGTSFAAPIVSSIVACMLEACPGLTPLRVKEILLATAEVVPGVSRERQGHGVIDPRAAVKRALREHGAPLEGLPETPCLGEDGRVRFVIHSEDLRPVSVIGAFNRWDPEATPFRPIRPRVFEANMDVPPSGEWRYRILLDDDSWMDHPDNPLVEPDGYGEFLSRLIVP